MIHTLMELIICSVLYINFKAPKKAPTLKGGWIEKKLKMKQNKITTNKSYSPPRVGAPSLPFRGWGLLLLLLFSFSLHAQLEKVIVEKYYISDQFDATDTIGGKLDSGSTTYRVYIDMKPGYALTSICGDVNHTLKISSTAPFFNNIDRGQSLGKDINSIRLYENTVALDTWLTLGQVTKSAAKTYFGILKTQDKDSSIIGGKNNNGGSAIILGGLLVNKNPAAGIPLTTADGMEPSTNLPINWADYGINDIVSGVDSTIFGSAKVDSQFISNNVGIQCSGAIGVNPDSNQVIVAQLTTKGDLSFELNITIADSAGNTLKYVANDSILLPGEKLSRYLKYPFHLLCDCPDPNYIEYNPSRDCDNKDSCKKPVVFGCMDSLACNYDPNANFSVPNLCCYPGYCNDQNIAVVCRTILLGINEPSDNFEFNLYPSPAQEQLNIQVTSNSNKDAYYDVYDYSGKLLLKKNMGIVSGTITEQMDVSNLAHGLYLVHLFIGNTSVSKKFIKE